MEIVKGVWRGEWTITSPSRSVRNCCRRSPRSTPRKPSGSEAGMSVAGAAHAGGSQPVQIHFIGRFIARLCFGNHVALFFKFERRLLLPFLQPFLKIRQPLKLLPPC